MPRQHFGAALIISSALLAPRHAGNRRLIVEEPDAFAVLALMIFHNKAKSRVKAINGQWLLATMPIRISSEKWEAMLPGSLQSENCITKIEHVMLVANCGRGNALYGFRRRSEPETPCCQLRHDPLHVLVLIAPPDDLPTSILRMPIESCSAKSSSKALRIYSARDRHINGGD